MGEHANGDYVQDALPYAIQLEQSQHITESKFRPFHQNGTEGQEGGTERWCPQPEEKENAPTFWRPKTVRLWWHPKNPWKSSPRRIKLDHSAFTKFPLTMGYAVKKTTHSCLYRCQGQQDPITQAVKKLYETIMARVHTQIRSD